MGNNIRIGLIEDQELFREGMKAILSSCPDFKVVFEAGEGYSVMEKLAVSTEIPDVMLVDLSLPPKGQTECSGLHVTMFLTEVYPDMRVLILSAHDDENFISQLIEYGAHGYLVKDSNPGEVFEAVRAAYEKGSYINERALRAIQRNMGRKQKNNKISNELTTREIEVLQLVCQQMTAEEIADKLFISVKTVNGHRNNLLQKTGSRNVTGLVLYAIKNDLVTV